jgi:hypothetical protein
MSRVSRFNISNRKKGILALEALIGTILSVIALVVLVGYFNNILVQKDNISIAEENAKSIGDFVNYFQTNSNYKTQENCFNIMRLDFQTHFQYSDDGFKNFAYIIYKEAVYLIPFSEIITLNENIDNGNVNLNNYKKVVDFKTELNLLFDETDKISLNFLTNIVFATDNLNLELVKLEDNDFYILQPNVVTSTDKVISYVPFVTGETNNYEVSAVNKKDIKILEYPTYLVYSNINSIYENNLLFVTNSKYTIPQIKSNLCSQNSFNQIKIRNFYKDSKNILNIDYNNYDIIFKDIIENDNINNNINTYSFEWKNAPVCKVNTVIQSCETIFKLNNVGYYIDGNFVMTFKDFIFEIELFSKYNQNINNFENWGIKSYKPSQVVDKKIYFRDVFTKLDQSKYKFEQLSNTDYLFQNNFFDISQVFNSNINDCDESECNLIHYGNKYKMYFYAGTGILEEGFFNDKITNFNMYYFNEQLLRKNKTNYGNRDISYDIFYNNNKIELSKINLEQKGIDFPGVGDSEDEKFVYKMKIPNITMDDGNIKDIEVFIGGIQFNNIQQYNPEEQEVIIE